MDIMTHAKFHFNRLMLTLVFGIWAWRTTENAGPDRVNCRDLLLESNVSCNDVNQPVLEIA